MPLTDSDLALRKTGITGSDAAALVGASSWSTPFSVWCAKKRPELLPPLTDERKLLFEMGHLQEPIVAKIYERRTGDTLFCPGTFRCTDHPFMVGSPDRFVNSKPKGLEIKTITPYARKYWGEEGTDQIPIGYFYQCLHYQLMTGRHEWDVAGLFSGHEVLIYYAPWDDELAAHLLAVEEEFYRRYVAGDEMPPIDASDAAKAYIKTRWPKSDPSKVIELTGQPIQLEWQQRVQYLVEAKRAAEAAKDKLAQAEADVKILMGEHERLFWNEGGVKIIWKSNKEKSSVSWKEIAEELLAKLPETERAAIVSAHKETGEGARPFKVEYGEE